MKTSEVWGTIVIRKGRGGRATILNSSSRGLFRQSEKYFNHQLKDFESGEVINVTFRLSKTGRRMVQELRVKRKTL